MNLVLSSLLALLITVSTNVWADWTEYPIKGKFVYYSYDVLSGSKGNAYIKLKLLSNYSKAQDIEVKNQSISYLSRVDIALVNCTGKTKEIQISAFELFEDGSAKGWSYKGVPKKLKWDKVPRKSTLDSLLVDICSRAWNLWQQIEPSLVLAMFPS